MDQELTVFLSLVEALVHVSVGISFPSILITFSLLTRHGVAEHEISYRCLRVRSPTSVSEQGQRRRLYRDREE